MWLTASKQNGFSHGGSRHCIFLCAIWGNCMQAQGAPLLSPWGEFKCMIVYVPREFASFLSCWKRGTRGDVLRCIMQSTNWAKNNKWNRTLLALRKLYMNTYVYLTGAFKMDFCSWENLADLHSSQPYLDRCKMSQQSLLNKGHTGNISQMCGDVSFQWSTCCQELAVES